MNNPIKTVVYLIEIARPRQWIKNAFVFAALIFAQRYTDPVAVWKTVLAFLLFCMFSSCVYMINDVADIERDRIHPKKKTRPLPSGRLSVSAVIVGCAVLGSVSLLVSLLALPPYFTFIALSYVAIHIYYSYHGKSAVVLDGMLVASGFVLRTYAGAVVIEVNFSDWLYICAMFVSLFLAFCKRRHEMILLGEDDAASHRAILQEYSTQLLDQIIAIVTAATLVTYSLYCIDGSQIESLLKKSPHLVAADSANLDRIENTVKYHPKMKYSIPFVIYGVFRYLYLVYRKEEGGNPTELLLTDRPLLLNGFFWLFTVFWALANG